VRQITKAETINTLGFCVGGTILSTALAVLAARGEHPAHSVTLLTTLLDFSDTGILDIFVDEALVKVREMTIGADAPSGPGLLKGQELATTFSFLRPTDLVWNYVVGNYLKGEAPPPFDLLYWNGDSTNLPGPMYCWYLRHMYLQNELRKPGALTVCGQKVDLGRIKAPVYIYGSREDHIVPWMAAYRSVPLFKGKRRFVLGASGHIAGVINPPAQRKRSHRASLVRWCHRACGQLVARLGRMAEGPGGWAGGCAPHLRQPRLQGHRARSRPLRQGQGLTQPAWRQQGSFLFHTNNQGDQHDEESGLRDRWHGWHRHRHLPAPGQGRLQGHRRLRPQPGLQQVAGRAEGAGL